MSKFSGSRHFLLDSIVHSIYRCHVNYIIRRGRNA